MIVIFGPSPDICVNTGVRQRAFGVDILFGGRKRVYINFSQEPLDYTYESLRGASSNLFKLVLNPVKLEHRQIISDFLNTAELIYSHSIFGLEHVIEFLEDSQVQGKLVTDMHGVVPEESLLQGNGVEAAKFNRIEEKVVQSSALLIMVSERMEKHFRGKYSKIKFKSIVLPIFPNEMTFSAPLPIDCKPSVIYAGGLEKWQNFDKMLDLVQKLSGKFTFKFFSFSKDELIAQITQRGLIQDVEIGALFKSEEMKEQLKTAHYGLVLRDTSIVNQVSCPTKLVDYLYAGVIPIILSPAIGDFQKLGYQFLSIGDALEGRLPDEPSRQKMIVHNHEIIKNLHKDIFSSFNEVIGLIRSPQVNLEDLKESLLLRDGEILCNEKRAAESRVEFLRNLRERTLKYRVRRLAGSLKHKVQNILLRAGPRIGKVT
jgi:hypothetical protein